VLLNMASLGTASLFESAFDITLMQACGQHQAATDRLGEEIGSALFMLFTGVAGNAARGARSRFGKAGAKKPAGLPKPDDRITVHHGTTLDYAGSVRKGVDVKVGDPHTDFGLGFYTTKDYFQAMEWAIRQANERPGSGIPEVVSFQIKVSDLHKYEGLVFKGPTVEWGEFVIHNRSGGPLHAYDYVEGPLLIHPTDPRFFTRIPLRSTGHQLSFHTEHIAKRVLDKGRLD
jgi:uncharacterized protein DUF3990